MRLFVLFIFFAISTISNSQNNYSSYDDAIKIIKSSSEFTQFLSNHKIKNQDFNVSEGLYPICVYSKILNAYVSPCKSTNWLEIWPKEQIKDLEKLGIQKNKKFLLRFTNTENSYFISELTINSQKESLIYLFQIEDDKLTLVKTIFK